MQCPRCGLPIPAGSWQQSQQFEKTAAGLKLPGLPAPINVQSVFRKTPVRKMELIADVVVPLAQATVSGLLVGGLATPLIIASDGPWYAGLYLGALSVGIVWGFRRAASKETLWIIEELTGADIDGDGHAGEPPAPAYGIKAEVKSREGWQFATLPGEPASLHYMAQMVSRGSSFSERTATSAGLSQPEWMALRDEFITRGWAHWKNADRPQVGVALLGAGRAVLRSIAANPPPPPDNL